VFAQEEAVKNINISTVQLKQLMAQDSSLVILDVRTPEELTGELGHIKGVINIPVQVLKERIAELDKYKDKDIYVICRSGNRSQYGTKILREEGFKAFNVLGGMRAYNSMK
ncbi:MAG: rhodanese-like domain-containing protein, partial [Chlorobi bacterium]|nr:rhodanese-like domain-containing protein [Chlorobiota bacterium]